MSSQNADTPSKAQPKLEANIEIDISNDNDNTLNDEPNKMGMGTTNSRVGLNKEELMRYANQPFWNNLRNGLFASFWIVWFSILFAAIAIVWKSQGQDCPKQLPKSE